MESLTLRTERLLLSPPEHRDAESIRRLCQDPVLSRYIPAIGQPYTLDHAVSFLDFTTHGWDSGLELTWALRRPDGELIGVISLRRDTADDVGFWLGAEYRGHGYLPEALNAVLDWAFDEANPHRVESVGWECLVGNLASAAVARKCGFTFEGEGPSRRESPDGRRLPSWQGRIRAGDAREPKPGWPGPPDGTGTIPPVHGL